MGNAELSDRASTLVTIGGVGDALAKALATLGAVALATAFLYDFTFWSFIDRRVLSIFVVADHIQTAVYAFAITVFMLIGVASCTFGLDWISPRILKILFTRAPWLARRYDTILFFLGTLIGSFVFSFEGSMPAFVVVSIIWLSLICRHTFSEGAILRNQLIMALILWLVVTALFAYADARRSQLQSFLYDSVTVETGADRKWNYDLKGRVVRMLDRGVVFRGVDGRMIFIPKERIQRIDQDVPSNNDPK